VVHARGRADQDAEAGEGPRHAAPTWLKAMEESVRHSLFSILCGAVHFYCSIALSATTVSVKSMM
jgi:hypothetical protein